MSNFDHPLPLDALDLGTSALFLGQALAGRAMARLAAEGFGDLRFAHGFVIQRLLAGDAAGVAPTPGDIARSLNVTSQAVSKTLRELEGLGYVARAADADDGRARRVELTERGRAAVACARRARADEERALREALGDATVDAARDAIARALVHLGVDAAVASRSVRPPT